MARKKQEIALQAELNTQEEWDDFMKKEGLLVVDVYQDWCGPCKAVSNFFRRIKNEIGDDFLNFAVAKADNIDSLEKYRNRCEPCFLIYGGRSLVGVIRGANPPVLETTIKLKLEEEHKVMTGEMERKETKDTFLADIEIDEKVHELEKDEEEIDQEVTLALIKPDAVRAGKVNEIIDKLQENGIEILDQQERNLTVDEAKEFYHHMKDSEHFEELIKFISSGPSKILILTKGNEGIIHEFQELVGPKVLDEAKESAPFSFRAIYGTNSIENAIHGSNNRETAQRELAFFFPDFVVPKISFKTHEESNVQRTLALIRPAAFTDYKDQILEKIENAGFKIAMQREVQLNKEDAALFYKAHTERSFFEDLISEMCKGTLLALALEKRNAVQGWRGMLGPKDVEKAKEVDPNSLRAQFFRDDIKINLLHGSDSDETAELELRYFFPIEQTIAAIKPDGLENEEEIINKILEAKFQIVHSKKIDMDKAFAEEFYSDRANEDYFNDLIVHMQSGPTLFMILSREDAIRGWRSLIGPKDPRIADELYPDSIRAIYGRDIEKNAVYGSDDAEEVLRVMQLIFGHLEFNKDGTLSQRFLEKPIETETVEQEISISEEKQEENEVEGVKVLESPKLFDSSERILMEPEVSEQSETRGIDDIDSTEQGNQQKGIHETDTENEVLDESKHSSEISGTATGVETVDRVVDSKDSDQVVGTEENVDESTSKLNVDSTQQETITETKESTFTESKLEHETTDKTNENTSEMENEVTNIKTIEETKEETTVVEETVVSEIELGETKTITKEETLEEITVIDETVISDNQTQVEIEETKEETTVNEEMIISETIEKGSSEKSKIEVQATDDEASLSDNLKTDTQEERISKLDTITDSEIKDETANEITLVSETNNVDNENDNKDNTEVDGISNEQISNRDDENANTEFTEKVNDNTVSENDNQ